MEDTGLDIAGSPTRPAELDFLSPEFSAEQALVCSPSRIQLPCPEVQPCDNLDHYSSVVRGLSRKLAPPPPSSSCPARPEAEKAKCASLPVQKNVKTVLTFMETPELGPLSLVQRCRAEGKRVRVVVRHCAGVRGECVGTVVAFDKHLNLVLGNVCEYYTPYRTVANGGVEHKAHRKGQRHKAATLTGSERRSGVEGQGSKDTAESCRQLDKLFIRGDNIVLMCPAPPTL